MFTGPYYLPRGYHIYGRHTHSDIGGPTGYLATLRTFAGQGMSGGWESDRHGGSVFVVRSCDSVIAVCDTHGQRGFDDRHYSTTTSSHQSLAKKWLGVAVLPVPAKAA